jgi:hypothetical protein
MCRVLGHSAPDTDLSQFGEGAAVAPDN